MPRRHAPTEADRETRLRLVVLAGPGAGRKYLVQGDEILGRSEHVAIELDDPKVSREHARIVRDNGGLAIEDLGSRNGTTLNGVSVKRASLSVGDRVQLGSEVVLLVTRYDPSEQQLLERQRLEMLGRLGAGLAHDLRNVQTVILAGLDYIQESPPGTPVETSDIQECLSDVRAASSRATELVTRLLSLARSDDLPYADVDLTSLCAESLRLARVAFGARVTTDQEIAKNLWIVGNGAEIHQTFMNLCLNARDAMPKGGRLTVSARRANDDIVVTFSDTGHGMDEDTRAQVFEPFFTTRRREGGFGIGLTTVRDIIAAHGGTVDVESTLGVGTTFRIVLPAAPKRERRAKPTAVIPAINADLTGVILLVDDDTGVLNSFRRILTRAGHEVITATDGVDALRKLGDIQRDRPGKPDLILLDRDMPRMGGDEALAEIKNQTPAPRVVLLSGSSSYDPTAQARADGLLSKPIGADELLLRVSEALAKPSDEDTSESL
ncbi:MAG TPA: ATP-binding protein [Polyangiaceae bacterium]|nr:ATP-binding protein [Polyangiaceae bacterium]